MTRRFVAAALFVCLMVSMLPYPASALLEYADRKGYQDYPYRALAYIETEFECGCTRIGTGAMICENGLITAGHMFICSKHNKKAEDITFYFGYKSDTNYYYKYDEGVTYFRYCDFSKGYDSTNDIAYVRFKTDVGNTTGWFGTEYNAKTDYQNKKCYILGYDEYGNIDREYTTAKLDKDGKRLLLGVSSLPYTWEGGPIYVQNGEKAYSIIGVYTCYNTGTKKGIGRRIDKTVFDDMKDDLNFGR